MFRKVVDFLGGRKMVLTMAGVGLAVAFQQYWMIPWIVGTGTGSIALEDGMGKLANGIQKRKK